MKISENIKLIITQSFIWRNRELLESKVYIEPKLTFLKFIKSNLILFLLGVMFSLYFNTFFNPEFAGYSITALSIFIGLFTSVLILIFDKFVNNPNMIVNKNTSDALKLNIKRTKNFSRKFVFISLEGLIIAITIILLFLIPLMLKSNFTIDLYDYKFVSSDIKFIDILVFIKNTIILLTRVFLVVLLYKFFKYLFVIFGFLGSYMKGVFDKNVKI